MALNTTFGGFGQVPERTILSDIGYDPTKPTGGGKNLSSRVAYEPMDQWAQNNLPNMLWQDAPAGVDLSSILGPNWQDTWDGTQGADYSSIFPNWNTWAAGAKSGNRSIDGLGVNADSLSKFLDLQKSQQAQGPGLGGALTGFTNNLRAENAPYLPTIVTGADGKQYVRYNQPEKPKYGFLDKAGDMILPASMAAVFGLGAADLFGGLGMDASWGVNPQGAGTMDFSDFITDFYSPGEFTGSMLPGGTNSIFGELGGGMVDLGGGAASVAGAGWSPSFLDGIMSTINNLPSGTGSAAKTLLGKVMGGKANQTDLMSLLGILGSTGLGMLGSNQQANSLEKIAAQSRSDRAPFLNAATGWMLNPASYYASGPAQEAMKGVLHGLSVNGNPANNPTAMGLATEAGLRNWQNAVTGFGNLGLSGQDSRNQLLSNAASADRGVTASLASGLGSLTQPQNSLEDLMKLLNMQGL